MERNRKEIAENSVLKTMALTKSYKGILALDHIDVSLNRGKI